jgi:hypothetical protein
MKKHFLTILIIFQLSAAFSQIGTVTNIQVAQRTDGSGKVDVYFNLSGIASAYYMIMEVSFNAGGIYTPLAANALSGDVGPITTGSNKHIIWDGLGSYPNTYSSETMVKLTASTIYCGQSFTANHIAGIMAPVDKMVTYGTVRNIPGEAAKCWITSNLGADHQATSVDDATEASAGWYFQFNRLQGYKHDGTTRTPNTVWITSISENSNWIAANDPCAYALGSGWRIPTNTEWTNVDASGFWNSWTNAYSSELKLHAAGYMNFTDGSLLNRGLIGHYWCNIQVDANNGWFFAFSSSNSGTYLNLKTYGFSVRCLID